VVGGGAQALGALGVSAVFLALGGVYWDVTWHVVVGRESFWIPPHLLIYSGTAVFFFSVASALLLTVRRAVSFRATGRAGTGFLVGILGSLIQVSAAPPVFLLAPALVVDLASLGKADDSRGVLLAAILFGPAFVLGEWAFRIPFGVTNWEPLEIVASLTTVTLAAAAGVFAGVFAGDRLQSLLRSG
jgi:hypothetical protein